MPNPFVDPDRVALLGRGNILVVERREAIVRDTAAHSHAPGQLLGSAEGLMSVATPRGRFVVPATHAVWLPPHCEHALRSHGPFRGWAIYAAEGLCDALPSRPLILRISELLRAAVSRAASWDGPARTPSERRLASVMLDEIASLPEEPLGIPMPKDRRLGRVAEALLADLADTRELEAWAGWAAIPTRTLSRRFVAETGFTFTAWRQRARALAALERLAQGEAVTTIALDLGYENVSAFIAMFRRTMGVTPGRYSPAISGLA
jgi:AraC-like DNA-binding protein